MKKLLLFAMLLLLIPLAQAEDLTLTDGATYTIGVNKTYDKVSITNGAILYFAYNTSNPVLTVTNWMYVQNATLSANLRGIGGGAGASSQCSAGQAGSVGGNWRCEPGIGSDGTGAGGAGASNSVNGTNKEVSWGGGAGGGGRGCNINGGAGNAGGGIIHIIGLTGTIITINGTITADAGSGGAGGASCGCSGAHCGAGGGGGAGGTILIDSKGVVNLTGSTISVQGANGGPPTNCVYTCGSGGAGGAGQSKVFYWTLYNSSVSALGDTSIHWEQQAPEWAVTLNTPTNNLMSKNATIIFNCSAQKYSGFNISNVTLLIDGATNYTQAASGSSASIQTSQNVPEGAHVWNCEMRDTNNSRFTSINNRTLTIDITNPSLNMTIAPTYVSRRTGNVNNVSFNWTASDTYFSSTWLTFNSVNYTPIGTTPNFGYNLSITTGGINYVYVYAVDTAGNMNSSVTSVYLNLYNYSVDYQPYVVQNKETTISFYLSATDTTQYNATLVYNGTAHTMTEYYNPLYKLLKYTFTTPSVNATTAYPFYINFSLDNEIIKTTNYNQTVQAIPALTIAQSCSTAFFRFALFNEGNLSSLNGTFEYNFKHGLENTDKKETYGTITNSHQIEICTNFSLSDHWIISYGEIIYYSSEYEPRRYYIYNGTYVSTSAQNISLYDIQTADSTTFQLTAETTSLRAYINKYINLLRWYPNLNTYKTVEMGKTDEKGQTLIHVKSADADYRIGLYEHNGSLIKLVEPTRFLCLTSPCSYTIQVSPSDLDYTSLLGIQYTFTFSPTTNIWTFTYSDPSMRTSTMNMTIYKITGTSIYPICNNFYSGYVGVLTCNTTGYTGNLKGVVQRMSSPAQTLVSKLVSILDQPFKSSWGLWLSLLIALPIITIGVMFGPIPALIAGIVSLIPALYFGSISTAVVASIAVMGFIVSHFLKRIGGYY
ncbi:MAG: hypothetical protein QME12_06625 [Nanoarchaeota archaeon]|nr:hypothetical protein [Nanoarchaeota archaeon]